MKLLTVYAVALILFLALDYIWLVYVAKNFYWTRLDGLLLAQPRFGIAAFFYAFWVAGLVWFAILPAMSGGTLSMAVFNGALFGFFTYLTYNGTNMAIMKGYDPVVAVVDTSWGIFAGAVVSGCAVAVCRAVGFPQLP